MSDKDTKEEDLESAQKDHKKVGKAGSDPETLGPAEELCGKACQNDGYNRGFRRTSLMVLPYFSSNQFLNN